MSDHTSDKYEHGFAVGVRTGVELEHILQDLIAELRRNQPTPPDDRRFLSPLHWVFAVERAERRLKELADD